MSGFPEISADHAPHRQTPPKRGVPSGHPVPRRCIGLANKDGNGEGFNGVRISGIQASASHYGGAGYKINVTTPPSPVKLGNVRGELEDLARSGASLAGFQLAHANLRDINLNRRGTKKGYDLSNADLFHADLLGAHLF